MFLETNQERYSVDPCNGETDIENRIVDTMEEREGGTHWERSIETYALACV